MKLTHLNRKSTNTVRPATNVQCALLFGLRDRRWKIWWNNFECDRENSSIRWAHSSRTNCRNKEERRKMGGRRRRTDTQETKDWRRERRVPPWWGIIIRALHLLSKDKACLICLHGCGDLSASVLYTFAKWPQCATLVSVGCCYHKLSITEIKVSLKFI